MAATSLSHYLRAGHEGVVRTELGLPQTVALFNKGLPRAKGMFEQEGVSAWRIGDPNSGDRFGLEAIYPSPKDFPPGFTVCDVHAFGPGTEIGCVSRFRRANWLYPAMWVTFAVGISVAAVVVDGPKELPLSAAILFLAVAAVLCWRGYCRFRLARDHDYVLLYMALAVKGQRVRDQAHEAPVFATAGAP